MWVSKMLTDVDLDTWPLVIRKLCFPSEIDELREPRLQRYVRWKGPDTEHVKEKCSLHLFSLIFLFCFIFRVRHIRRAWIFKRVAIAAGSEYAGSSREYRKLRLKTLFSPFWNWVGLLFSGEQQLNERQLFCSRTMGFDWPRLSDFVVVMIAQANISLYVVGFFFVILWNVKPGGEWILCPGKKYPLRKNEKKKSRQLVHPLTSRHVD